MKRLCIILLLFIVVVACEIYKANEYVGKVKDIISVNPGGFTTSTGALVVVDTDKKLVLANGIWCLTIGKEIYYNVSNHYYYVNCD